jgi:hypothetical protein
MIENIYSCMLTIIDFTDHTLETRISHESHRHQLATSFLSVFGATCKMY